MVAWPSFHVLEVSLSGSRDRVEEMQRPETDLKRGTTEIDVS